jgi:hypothetical protein
MIRKMQRERESEEEENTRERKAIRLTDRDGP